MPSFSSLDLRNVDFVVRLDATTGAQVTKKSPIDGVYRVMVTSSDNLKFRLQVYSTSATRLLTPFAGVSLKSHTKISEPIFFNAGVNMLFECYGLSGSHYIQFSFIKVGDE